MARKMALFTNRLLLSWTDSMRGAPILLHRQASLPSIGVDGQRFFAASTKGKGTAKNKINAKAEATDEEPKKKGPRNAYQLFQKQSGPAILAKLGPTSLPERSRILAGAWKKLSDAEKATYAAQIVVGSSKPLSSLPRNTYQLFVRQSSTEILAKHPEVKTIADRSRVLAAEWKTVPAEEKDRLAAELEKIAPARARAKRQKAPTISKFALYVKENFHRVSKEQPNSSAAEVMRELGSAWKTLSDSQKAGYSTKA